MKGAWPEALRACGAAARAAKISLRAPGLLAVAVLPVAAAKLLSASVPGHGLGSELMRVVPVAVAAAALSLFALLFCARLGRHPLRVDDEAVMTFCYALVALLISSSVGAWAEGRFDAALFARSRIDLATLARASALFVFAAELSGLAWTVLVVLGLPSLPRHPELFGALWQGLGALARRPAAAAVWIAAAAAGDWLLARGGGGLAAAAAGGRLSEPALLMVAWARQTLVYVLLCGAPLAAAQAP